MKRKEGHPFGMENMILKSPMESRRCFSKISKTINELTVTVSAPVNFHVPDLKTIFICVYIFPSR